MHPLVSHNSSTLNDVSFNSRLADTEFYATDHTVNQEQIFPGSGFLEIAAVCGSLAAEQRTCRIRDVIWGHPLSFREGPQDLRTYMKHIGEAVEYAITSLGEDNEQVVHSEGRLLFLADGDDAAAVDAPPATRESLHLLKERCTIVQSADDIYRGFATHGLIYGRGLQVIRELYAGETCVLARLQLPDHLKEEFAEFVLHPALIDGALQTVAALLTSARAQRQYLPFALEEMDLLRPLTQVCYAFAESAASSRQNGSQSRKFNIQILNENGDVLVRLRNLHMMPLDEALVGHSRPVSPQL
jgi:polyketide synthase PksL